MKAPARTLAAALCLAAASALAGPRVAVFDCGRVALDSLEMFGLEPSDSDVREFFVPCYLVEHEAGRLFFDAGLSRAIADADGAVPIDGGALHYTRWVVDQLAAMDMTPSDIDFLAFSHLHFDHVGAAEALAGPTVLMQEKEWSAAFSEAGVPAVDTALVDDLDEDAFAFIDGDHDVFGDGSVRLLFSPGHTPGHQVLYLELETYGPLVISGDLYHTRANRRLRRPPVFNVDAEQTRESMTRIEDLIEETGATLWIEHDAARAETLELAPAFYD